MMSGDLFGAGDSSDRKLVKNGRISPSDSPLKIFAQAKKKINDVFNNIGDYVANTRSFLIEYKDDVIISEDMLEKSDNYVQKVKGIKEMLKRDRMKVAFYGRTSNGKSTVINAMLRSKILPTGMGHTTNCFLQVEGTSKEGTLRTEDGESKPMTVQSINGLAHALSSFRLKPESTIYISWPKDKCALLRDDVVFLDSPGIDITPDMDSWIDQQCLDADVFVLVSNAESTLMQTEKNFFHKVSLKLSKPNIFILHNRWDASAHEPEWQEQVRSQHMERSITFLTEELKVMDKYEAEDRVFFVSARETLITRIAKEQGTPTPSGQLLDGYQSRLFEFCNFERKFEECISQTAVQTKFEQHTFNGKSIINDLKSLCGEVYDDAIHNKEKFTLEFETTEHKLYSTQYKLESISEELKQRINQMILDVERKVNLRDLAPDVSLAFNDEIRRLSLLVNEFEHTFHSDEFLLALYKKELNAHVDSGFGRNLQSKCSVAIKTAVLSVEDTLAEKLMELLPEENQRTVNNLKPSRNFEVAYRLDCKHLCADFREDINFHFSLGLSSLAAKFIGSKSSFHNIISNVPSTPQTPSNENRHRNPTRGGASEADLMMALVGNFSKMYSRSTLGSLAIAGLIGKAAGWRVICVCGVAYGALYFYERTMWTRKAKEKAFKKQYVDYASNKLRLIVDLTASNCSHQVKQELESTFERLIRHVDIAKDDLEHMKSTIKERMAIYEKIAFKANYLKNSAGFIENELNLFTKEYLKSTAASKL